MPGGCCKPAAGPDARGGEAELTDRCGESETRLSEIVGRRVPEIEDALSTTGDREAPRCVFGEFGVE